MPAAKVEERIRLISREPLITYSLRQIKPLVQLPVRMVIREVALDWLEDIERTLRSREFWVSMLATEIGAALYNAIKKPLVQRIRQFFPRFGENLGRR